MRMSRFPELAPIAGRLGRIVPSASRTRPPTPSSRPSGIPSFSRSWTVVLKMIAAHDRQSYRRSVSVFDRRRHELAETVCGIRSARHQGADRRAGRLLDEVVFFEGQTRPRAIGRFRVCEKWVRAKPRLRARTLEKHPFGLVRRAAADDVGEPGGLVRPRLVDAAYRLREFRTGDVRQHRDAVVQRDLPERFRRIAIHDHERGAGALRRHIPGAGFGQRDGM